MIDEIKKLRELTETLTGNGYLRDQAEEWAYALDAIPEFVYIIDNQHNLKFVNKALAARLGKSKEDLFNEKCFTIIKGYDADSSDCAFPIDCCNLEDNNEASGEVYLEKLNGWFIYDRSPIYTNTQKLIGFICILRDITEKKKLFEETEKRQKVLDTVFNTAPLFLGLLERDSRNLITVNDTFCEVLGYEEEEVVGKNVSIIYPSMEDYEEVGLIKAAGLEESGTARLETKFKAKDGRIIDVALSTSTTGNDNELVFAAADITNRRNRERMLKLNEARTESLLKLSVMDEKDEEDLIEFVLEEAVALTGSKIGYIHLTDEDENGVVNLNLFKWSKAVHDNCDAKSVPHYPLEQAGIWADCVRTKEPAVHNDYNNLPGRKGLPLGHFPLDSHMSVPVLDGSKVVAVLGVGNKELPYDESDIKQLTLFLNSMWDIIKRKRTESNFSDLISSTPLGILTYALTNDKLILKQANPAAENILGLKFENCVGKTLERIFPVLVKTEVPEVYRDIARNGGIWSSDAFAYEDEANGISGVFSVFVYQIRKHEIAVFFSDVTEKSKMLKELSSARYKLTHAEDKIKKDLKAFTNKIDKDKKILIVEDQRTVSELLGRYIEALGYDVKIASDGQEAADLIDKNGICLVIVDLKLPAGPTGIDIIKKVAESHTNTPIIVVSGTTAIADVDDAMRAGAWDFISKPFSMDIIKASVEKNIKQSLLMRKSKLLDEFLELTN
jgi:PAS domain S-box-containing protein